MEKEAIAQLLETSYKDVINWFQNQEDTQWETGPDGKWTSGQQAMHLLQSIKPLNNALSLPKFVLKYKLGDCLFQKAPRAQHNP